MSGRAARIYVVAAERSGDLLGAGLIRALREQAAHTLDFAGVGGAAMAEEGVESPFDISQLSILGFFEGIRAYPRVKARVADTVEHALAFKPDAVVLVDSWGFTLRVAQALRKADPSIKLIKYVGPQVFGSRPGRARTLAATVDHLLTIHSFDAHYFEQHGLPVSFVGNPSLERKLDGDGAAFRRQCGIAEDGEVVALLFGSRPAELERMYEPIVAAAAQLRERRPGLALVIPLAGPIDAAARGRIAEDVRLDGAIVVDEKGKADAFAAADIAIACSGTVTSELATLGVPAVVAYKLGWVTWTLIRWLGIVTLKYASLVNIAADEALFPEFIQGECTPDAIAAEAGALLDDADRRADLSQRLKAVTSEMRGGGRASERAAESVLSLLQTE